MEINVIAKVEVPVHILIQLKKKGFNYDEEMMILAKKHKYDMLPIMQTKCVSFLFGKNINEIIIINLLGEEVGMIKNLSCGTSLTLNSKIIDKIQEEGI